MEAKEEDHLDILEVDPQTISMEASLEAVQDRRHLITEAVSMTEDLLEIVLDLTI